MATVEKKSDAAGSEQRVTAGDIYRSPHIRAADLTGDTVVTIKSFELDKEVGGAKKERRGVIYFEEFSRGLVMNKTNTDRVVGLHGKVVNAWIGKQITLYESEAMMDGKVTPCVRVREK
jgi:hypothetical protein